MTSIISLSQPANLLNNYKINQFEDMKDFNKYRKEYITDRFLCIMGCYAPRLLYNKLTINLNKYTKHDNTYYCDNEYDILKLFTETVVDHQKSDLDIESIIKHKIKTMNFDFNAQYNQDAISNNKFIIEQFYDLFYDTKIIIHSQEDTIYAYIVTDNNYNSYDYWNSTILPLNNTVTPFEVEIDYTDYNTVDIIKDLIKRCNLQNII